MPWIPAFAGMTRLADDASHRAGRTHAYTAGMRLSTAQRLALKQRFLDELGPDCVIRIFGSRADDAARGGDVDLLVQCPRRLDRKVWLAARLAASAERSLEGRKVDVLLVDPDTPLQPVHRAALREGIVL